VPRLLAVLGALTALAAMTPALAARGVDAPRRPSATTTTVLSPPPVPTSFGQDPTGELYVLSLAGAVFRLEPAT